MDAIKAGNAKLKKTVVVARRKSGRSNLMDALKKGEQGLKHVVVNEDRPRPEEKRDAAVLQLLQNRKAVAGEVDSDSDSDFDSEFGSDDF